MDNQYICPYCRGHLRVGDNIVFKIRNTRREKGLLLLHPEVGHYSSVRHPKFYFEEGERIDFFCPLCMQSLDAALDENLVYVVMVDSDQNEHEIYFSRSTGEQSTYKGSEEGVTETGMHSHRYTCFKMPDKHIQYLDI